MRTVSWLDWKLGARMLLKHPALTIIGGLSLGAVGVLACAAPARRALRIQPTEALRQG